MFTGLFEIKCKSLCYVAAKDCKRLSFPRGMFRITNARVTETRRNEGGKKDRMSRAWSAGKRRLICFEGQHTMLGKVTQGLGQAETGTRQREILVTEKRRRKTKEVTSCQERPTLRSMELPCTVTALTPWTLLPEGYGCEGDRWEIMNPPSILATLRSLRAWACQSKRVTWAKQWSF